MEQIDNDDISKIKKGIIELLEEVLKREILDIENKGIEKFKSIIGYNFSLLKLMIIYKDLNQEEIYLKIIKRGKIKESIFCYWSLLYDEYIKSNNDKKDLVQKAIITQLTSDGSNSHLILTINTKLNYFSEISLVELKNLINKDKERWKDRLEINNEDILFIGKKMY